MKILNILIMLLSVLAFSACGKGSGKSSKSPTSDKKDDESLDDQKHLAELNTTRQTVSDLESQIQKKGVKFILVAKIDDNNKDKLQVPQHLLEPTRVLTSEEQEKVTALNTSLAQYLTENQKLQKLDAADATVLATLERKLVLAQAAQDFLNTRAELNPFLESYRDLKAAGIYLNVLFINGEKTRDAHYMWIQSNNYLRVQPENATSILDIAQRMHTESERLKNLVALSDPRLGAQDSIGAYMDAYGKAAQSLGYLARLEIDRDQTEILVDPTDTKSDVLDLTRLLPANPLLALSDEWRELIRNEHLLTDAQLSALGDLGTTIVERGTNQLDTLNDSKDPLNLAASHTKQLTTRENDLIKMGKVLELIHTVVTVERDIHRTSALTLSDEEWRKTILGLQTKIEAVSAQVADQEMYRVLYNAYISGDISLRFGAVLTGAWAKKQNLKIDCLKTKLTQS